MAEGNLRVNFVMLHSAAADIGSTVSAFNGELDTLRQNLQGVIATWDGAAKAAYAAKQAQWDAAAADLNTLLTTIQGAITRSAEVMQAREQANTQRFS